jgi:hypothetical protein
MNVEDSDMENKTQSMNFMFLTQSMNFMFLTQSMNFMFYVCVRSHARAEDGILRKPKKAATLRTKNYVVCKYNSD